MSRDGTPAASFRGPGSSHAIVIGGGIGGVSTALGLARHGWQVTVLEQAPVFWEAGAGLTITPNGERALAALGLAAAVRRVGNPVSPSGIRDKHGRWLLQLTGLHAVSVHRRSLHSVLLEAASDDCDLRPGSRVLSVDLGRLDGEPAAVRWLDSAGEHTATADLVVGADGAGSTVRPLVDPGARYGPSGYAAWRAVVDDDQLPSDLWGLWWGPGLEFGAQRIGRSRVSWHCLFATDRGDPVGVSSRAITTRLTGWPADLVSVVARTPSKAIFRHDIVDSVGRPTSLHSGRTVLVGDAAHPLLPTISQGANLALEDGVSLGAALGSTSDLAVGLQAFDQLRIVRCTRVAKLARGLARLGMGSRSGPCVSGRTLLRLVPRGRVDRLIREVTNWAPPPGH